MEVHQTKVLEEEGIVYKPTTTSINAEPVRLIPGKKDEGKVNVFLYVAVVTANLMAFSAGTIFGWTSPAFPKLNGQIDPELNPLPKALTPFQESWIASLVGFGSSFGCFAAGKLSDKFGRKQALLISSVPMLVSVITVAFAQNVNLLYLGRILSGVSVGFIFSVTPMYIGEIAEDSNRGALGCSLGGFASFGILFSFSVGPFLTVKGFSLILTIPIILFMVIFTVFIPESPVYLISAGDAEGAQKALYRLRTKPDKVIKIELENMVRLVEECKSTSGGIRSIFRSKGLIKGLIITTSLVLLQQTCGITIVLSFMESIFSSTGADISPMLATIIVGSIQVVTTILTSFVVEKLGRKTLLLISAFGSSASIFCLGLYFNLQENGSNISSLSWLPVTSLIFYIISFNIGLGPLPWAILGEIFPANVKSIAGVLTSFTCFMSGFIITICFPYLSLLLGSAQTFWVFAISSACGFFFIYFYVIETKGKTLDEIQKCLSGIKKIHTSNKN